MASITTTKSKDSFTPMAIEPSQTATTTSTQAVAGRTLYPTSGFRFAFPKHGKTKRCDVFPPLAQKRDISLVDSKELPPPITLGELLKLSSQLNDKESPDEASLNRSSWTDGIYLIPGRKPPEKPTVFIHKLDPKITRHQILKYLRERGIQNFSRSHVFTLGVNQNYSCLYIYHLLSSTSALNKNVTSTDHTDCEKRVEKMLEKRSRDSDDTSEVFEKALNAEMLSELKKRKTN